MTATVIPGPWRARSEEDREIVAAFFRMWPRLSFLPDAWIIPLLQSEGITPRMMMRVCDALQRERAA